MPNRRKSNEMTASEAVYGFVSWLTTREKPITLSSKNDCSEISSLINEFIEAQNLESPRDGWEEFMEKMN